MDIISLESKYLLQTRARPWLSLLLTQQVGIKTQEHCMHIKMHSSLGINPANWLINAWSICSIQAPLDLLNCITWNLFSHCGFGAGSETMFWLNVCHWKL